MQLDQQELEQLAKRTGDRMSHSRASLLGGFAGFTTLALFAIAVGGISWGEFEDFFFYVILPGCLGGLIGSCAGLAIFLTITRRRTHPALAALLGGVLASVASAILTIIAAKLTEPEGQYHGGAGYGPQAGHAVVALFIYFLIVLPVSLIAGAASGWFMNRR